MRMGFPSVKLDRLNDILKQSVKNSAAKNYHGGLEVSFPVKDADLRVLEIIEEERLLSHLGNEENKDEENKDENEMDFLQAILTRHKFVALAYSINKNLTPGQLAFLADQNTMFNTDLFLFLT